MGLGGFLGFCTCLSVKLFACMPVCLPGCQPVWLNDCLPVSSNTVSSYVMDNSYTQYKHEYNIFNIHKVYDI